MVDFLVVVPFWVIGCAVVGAVAENRGRRARNWLLLSLVLSPMVGIFALLLFPSRSVDDSVLEAEVERSQLDVDSTQQDLEEAHPTTEPDR